MMSKFETTRSRGTETYVTRLAAPAALICPSVTPHRRPRPSAHLYVDAATAPMNGSKSTKAPATGLRPDGAFSRILPATIRPGTEAGTDVTSVEIFSRAVSVTSRFAGLLSRLKTGTAHCCTYPCFQACKETVDGGRFGSWKFPAPSL